MKRILLIIIATLFCANAYAGQKYNAFSGEWETVPNDWTTQYDPFSGKWSYQPNGARQSYNPFNGKYEWDSGNN